MASSVAVDACAVRSGASGRGAAEGAASMARAAAMEEPPRAWDAASEAARWQIVPNRGVCRKEAVRVARMCEKWASRLETVLRVGIRIGENEIAAIKKE